MSLPIAIRSLARKILRGIAIIFLSLLFIWLVAGLTPAPLLVNRSSFSQAVYDRRAVLLRLSLSSDEKYRLWSPLQEISPVLIQATLLKEDRHFWHHYGVNPVALFRGLVSTYLTRERRRGGSTISMQLARIRFGINSKTILGKMEQILRALQIERHYSKKEILEAYLNLLSYGGNVEGVAAASQIYFGHGCKDLSLPEALALAVIPQSPIRRGPGRTGTALGRARDELAQAWQKTAGVDIPFSLPASFQSSRELPFSAAHLVNEALDCAPYTSRVSTTLDRHLQTIIEDQIAPFVKRRQLYGIKNAAAMLVNYQSMEVVALVGSADFFDSAIQGQVDVTSAKRSPGSALKPFIYGMAIDQGLIHSQTMLKDTRLTISAYNPENFDKDFLGPLSATDALVKSRNVPAITLVGRLKQPTFYEFLKRARIEKLREEEVYGLSLALGGVEVSMREMVALYAMLANGGELKPLRWLSSDPLVTQATRLLSAEASFLVLQMLKDNPRPNFDISETHTNAGPSVAWKTGTSFGFRDAWAVGIVGPYALAVWIGNADGKPNPAFIGREAAGPLFFNIVDALRAEPGMKYAEIPMSANLAVKKVEVCAVSGMLPGPYCQQHKHAWFIPGRSPIETCNVHRQVTIDSVSGLRACPLQHEPMREEVYEIWPSDILALFKAAAIPRRVPPPYHPRCGISGDSGKIPSITSPQSTLIYTMRSGLQSGSALTIPFDAVTDSDSAKTYWFVDGALVGVAARGESFVWNATPGEFMVRAVDELGRAAGVKMKVKVR